MDRTWPNKLLGQTKKTTFCCDCCSFFFFRQIGLQSHNRPHTPIHAPPPDNLLFALNYPTWANRLVRAAGKLEEAEPLQRRAVEIGEQVLGPNSPDLATWVNNLGRLLMVSETETERGSKTDKTDRQMCRASYRWRDER